MANQSLNHWSVQISNCMETRRTETKIVLVKNNTYSYIVERPQCREWRGKPVLREESSIINKTSSTIKWAASSEFVSSSIPSWQALTAHAQPFRGARDLAFCLKVLLDSLLVWASSGRSGETARMRRLAWTVAARIGDKYQIRLTRSKLSASHVLNDSRKSICMLSFYMKYNTQCSVSKTLNE